MVMPARVYHREYKSVDEDQIGFQKYKIHGDIKKQKEARPFPWWGTVAPEGRGRDGDAEGACRRDKRGCGDWWPRFGPRYNLFTRISG